MWVAALLIIIFWFPWHNTKEMVNPQAIFLEYYQPYHFETVYRDGVTKEDAFDKSVSAHENGHWGEALILSDSLLLSAPTSQDNLLLNASIQMVTGNYHKAEDQFKKLLNTGGSFAQHSRWYLALIYLREGNLPDCIVQLRILSQTGKSVYSVKGSQIAQEIEITLKTYSNHSSNHSSWFSLFWGCAKIPLPVITIYLL